MKFGAHVHPILSEALRIIEEVRDVCSQSGKLLTKQLNSESGETAPFMVSALQFTRMNYENIASTRESVQNGFLAQSFVLLRWHLEMAHLFYYLFKKPAEYNRWLAGAQISPKEIGRFFQENQLAPWRGSYEDWSNMVHCNAVCVDNFGTIARTTSVSDELIALAAHALRNLMYNGHKSSMVTIELIKNTADVLEFNAVAKKYMDLEKVIFGFSDKQNEWEKVLMGLQQK